MEVSCRIIVDVPLDVAFSYYKDQDRLQEWIPGHGVLQFIPLTPAPKRVGSRYRMAYRSFGTTFRLVAELTKLEKNRLSEMDQVNGDYKLFHYEMHFSEAGLSKALLIMKIRAVLPWGFVGIIADWLSRSQARRDIEGVLRRFKTGAESLMSRMERVQQAQV